MDRLEQWFERLDEHPWWRGFAQGLGAAVALAVVTAVFGRSWDAVVVMFVAVLAVLTLVFGTLLSLQRRR
jgi:hypothetical protein